MLLMIYGKQEDRNGQSIRQTNILNVAVVEVAETYRRG